MKLEKEIRKHAQYWDCYNDCPLKYNHTGKLLKIIDNFSIEFADWCLSLPDNPVLYKMNGDYMPTKFLLEQFKKEKGY